MMKEKMSNNETQRNNLIAVLLGKEMCIIKYWEMKKNGYVRGLGLGPTPSLLWGCKSFL